MSQAARPVLRAFAAVAAAIAGLTSPAGAAAAQPPKPAPDLTAPLLRADPTPPTSLPTVWGCRPGMTPNPCEQDGATTVLKSTQSQPRVVDHVEPAPAAAPAPAIDCFYVYGTVTGATGVNAPRHTERAVDDILRWSTGRLGRTCRVFAPIYRQLPALSGIGVEMALGRTYSSRAQNTAFSDVLGAWRDYLAHDNQGRGVLIIGHSQGAAMLMRLMEREVDRNAAARAKLVGAFLIGANVAVKQGQRLGGNFAYLPTCAQAGEYGCVVAYSSFTTAPGGTAMFGRLGPLNKIFGAQYRLPYVPACTSPTELAGDGETVRPVLRGAAPSGGEGDTDRQFWNGRRATAPTAWVVPADRLTARCRVTPTTSALMIRRGASTQLPTAVPWADWGLHVRELALTMGNLERIAQLQAAAWLADHPG